jgi:rhamnosyltransferase
LNQQQFPVEQIFIVDNSRNQLLPSAGNITVEHHPENIGVAGGLKIAIAWAIEEGFDFLWMFDQDSRPDDPHLLKKLMDLYAREHRPESPIAIVAPLAIDIQRNIPIHGENWLGYASADPSNLEHDRDFYECDMVITSGSLLSIAAAQTAPLPLESLFLDAVDYFYCLALRRQGYRVLISRTAILNHQLGNIHTVQCPFSGQDIVTHTCSSLRYYYSCRNHTFMVTRFASAKLRSRAVLGRLNVMRQHLRHIRFYESEPRRQKMYACLRGTFDGLIGRLGRTW